MGLQAGQVWGCSGTGGDRSSHQRRASGGSKSLSGSSQWLFLGLPSTILLHKGHALLVGGPLGTGHQELLSSSSPSGVPLWTPYFVWVPQEGVAALAQVTRIWQSPNNAIRHPYGPPKHTVPLPRAPPWLQELEVPSHHHSDPLASSFPAARVPAGVS